MFMKSFESPYLCVAFINLKNFQVQGCQEKICSCRKKIISSEFNVSILRWLQAEISNLNMCVTFSQRCLTFFFLFV